jgi:hypothetical protein
MLPVKEEIIDISSEEEQVPLVPVVPEVPHQVALLKKGTNLYDKYYVWYFNI